MTINIMQKSGFSKRWMQGVFVLILAGLIFSGYLSATKLLSGTCAFNESCPYFLGYPACWYGFAMYLAMFIVTLFGLAQAVSFSVAFGTDVAVSALGIVFAGSFAIQEFLQSRITGVLGLSTCVYGLIFYLAIFTVSAIALKRSRFFSQIGS